MDAQSLTYLFVALSFGLYIGIAIWSRAGSTDEFYIAGGGVHPIANGMATAALNYVNMQARMRLVVSPLSLAVARRHARRSAHSCVRPCLLTRCGVPLRRRR